MHGLLFRGIRTRGGAIAIATVLALGIGTASVSANTFSLDLVYLGGHTVVPGEIETFNGPAISWASLNNFRQVSSLGSWTPAGQQFGELGMFKWEAGVLYDLMKDTDVTNAPGFASPPSGVQNGLISDTGNVAFRFGINGEDAIAKGPTRAGLTTIAVSGGANAPGNASPFLFLGSPQHNGTRLAFYGRSSGDIGIWTGNETNGVVYRFAQEDQTLLPGTASVIDDMIFREPVINTSGFTAAEVGWDGGKSAIIAGNPAAVNPLFTVAKTGDSAPGVRDAVFESFSRPRLNNLGTIAFAGYVDVGGGVMEDAIFRTSGGGIDDVVYETLTPVPVQGGFTFDDVSGLALAGDDNLYFRGSWDNYSRSGLFVQHPDTGLELLFKEGDAAPNTGSSFASFGFMHANAVGDYAFLAGLDDGRTGLFATVNGGVDLKLLLIEGQIIDATGAGDMAVISGFEMPISSGGEDGHGMWLSNNGELLIEIAFDPSRALPTVTSGLYLLTIPEPTSLTLLALMSAAAMRRRKR